MHPMVCIQPDISYAVSVVSRHKANPDKSHWQAVKWILRYLRGTIDTCLEFSGDGQRFVGFADLDHVRELHKRRSLTDYVFTLENSAIN